LDSQEDFLIKENKKIIKLKNAYAQEVEKCENLSKELSMCQDSISSFRNENTSLVSKIEKLNVCNDSISCLRDENARLKSKLEELNICKPSTSTVEHVSICTRCRDINVEAIDDHLAMIKKQNDHIAKLDAKIAKHELENENFKFAHSMLYNGRRPDIEDGIGFQ
jgi:chromosome segregation ATPase